MSYVNWIEIYEAYTAEELTAEIAALKKLNTGGAGAFTGQTVGGKSYSRDPNMIVAQLQAAVRVQNSRANPGRAPFEGVVAFMGVDGSSGESIHRQPQ